MNFCQQELFTQLQDVKADMFIHAEAMHTLCTQYGYTQSKLAKELGVSQSSIGNKMRLLQFSEYERTLIRQHGLAERHARVLLRTKPPKREKLIMTVGTMRMTVQQTEQMVDKYTVENYHIDTQTALTNLDTFIHQTQASAQRLCALGYKTTCMVESGESWRRITITILE